MSYFLHPGFGIVSERNKPKSVRTTGEINIAPLIFDKVTRKAKL